MSLRFRAFNWFYRNKATRFYALPRLVRMLLAGRVR